MITPRQIYYTIREYVTLFFDGEAELVDYILCILFMIYGTILYIDFGPMA